MATTAARDCTTVASVFNSLDDAERAVTALRSAGYRDDQIGLVGRDRDGKVVRKYGANSNYMEEGAAIGAATGAVAGAGVGAALIAGVIPVIGPVIAVGTLGTILVNAAGGAAVAGIAGALIGWGIPDEEAEYFEEQVKAGRYLVTVECGYGDDARDILSREGGFSRFSGPMV